MNDLNKIDAEYRAKLADNHTIWLKIRFIAGMEMLAQDMSTGRRIYEQDIGDRPGSPRVGKDPNDEPETSPVISPMPPSPSPSPSSPSPASPAKHPAITRRRSQHWALDATGSFPVLFIEEALVAFYSNIAEMKQALAEHAPNLRNKIIINSANVVSVEKVVTRQSYAQNISYSDVQAGVNNAEPKITLEPFVVLEPEDIPAITDLDQELMFRIHAKGGVAPYRYSMMNAPTDLYVTEDGWVRGFIEEQEWPTTGYREFLILILVEDSSIPVQTIGLEFRYRLYAQP